MSETPRTDVVFKKFADIDVEDEWKCAIAIYEFARKLETELAAANAKLEAAERTLAEARAAVIEECAKICDEGVKWEPKFPPNIQRVTDETACLLGKAIRALSPTQDAQGDKNES